MLSEANETNEVLNLEPTPVLNDAIAEAVADNFVEVDVLSEATAAVLPPTQGAAQATCSIYSVSWVTDQSATAQLFTPKFLRPVAPTSRMTGSCLGALVAGQVATWSYRTVSQARLSERVKLI